MEKETFDIVQKTSVVVPKPEERVFPPSITILQLFAKDGTEKEVNLLRELIHRVGGLRAIVAGDYNKETGVTTGNVYTLKTGMSFRVPSSVGKTGANAPVAFMPTDMPIDPNAPVAKEAKAKKSEEVSQAINAEIDALMAQG